MAEENMYDDEAAPSEDASVANDTNDSNDTKDDTKNDETEDQLSLVPKHFFKDEPKPGNREMVEVVSVYDGEVSIKCVYGDKDDKGGKEEKESESENKSESESEDEMMA